MMLCIAAYCGLVEYVEVQYFHLTDASRIRNVSIVHTLLGLALSMLLVFRTNTAYDRWWEARKLWGSLVNSSRSLSIQIAVVSLPWPPSLKFCVVMVLVTLLLLTSYRCFGANGLTL
jgi:predicted membrane chloride channel (bestrophin family)